MIEIKEVAFKEVIISLEKLQKIESLKEFVQKYESFIDDKMFKEYVVEFLDSMQIFQEGNVTGCVFRYNEIKKEEKKE